MLSFDLAAVRWNLCNRRIEIQHRDINYCMPLIAFDCNTTSHVRVTGSIIFAATDGRFVWGARLRLLATRSMFLTGYKQDLHSWDLSAPSFGSGSSLMAISVIRLSNMDGLQQTVEANVLAKWPKNTFQDLLPL